MENFTPVSSAIGGVMIGSAAVLLLLLNGKIAGVSGIYGALLRPKSGDIYWRVMFLLGLIAGAVAHRMYDGGTEIVVESSLPTLIIAGLLVGFSTRLGSGCTSGHGICGIGRFSQRSIVATVSFLVTGFATVYVMRHLIGG